MSTDPNNNDIHIRGPWAKVAAGLMAAALIGGVGLVVRMDGRLTELEQRHIALDARVTREREGITGTWAALQETNKRLSGIEQRLASIEGRLTERGGR